MLRIVGGFFLAAAILVGGVARAQEQPEATEMGKPAAVAGTNVPGASDAAGTEASPSLVPLPGTAAALTAAVAGGSREDVGQQVDKETASAPSQGKSEMAVPEAPAPALEAPVAPAAPSSALESLLSKVKIRFNGYARMPLRFTCRRDGRRVAAPTAAGELETGEGAAEVAVQPGGPCRFRSPRLIDDDFNLYYTNLLPGDWSELFLSADVGDVSVTFGFFASLYSDWAYSDSDHQFGIAQAYVHWRNIAGVKPLFAKAGVFWEKQEWFNPYDIPIYGRVQHMGAQLGLEFGNGAIVRLGGGAHLGQASKELGFTPVVYLRAGSPIGPVKLTGHLIAAWSNDRLEFEDGPNKTGYVLNYGVDAKITFPGIDNPLMVALAGYRVDHMRYVGGVLFDLGQLLFDSPTPQSFGTTTTGNAMVGLFDWPIHLWRGLSLQVFGLYGYIWNSEERTGPADRMAFKFGMEPSFQVLSWLRPSVRLDVVAPDAERLESAFQAISPTVTFTPLKSPELGYSFDIIVRYVHYFYGEELRLPASGAGAGQRPDPDAFMIMGQASW